MKYYEMIPLSEFDEFSALCDGKRCKMSDEQKELTLSQVQKVWGETEIIVSPRGVVFANSAEHDFKTLGRVDAKFNFVSKH